MSEQKDIEITCQSCGKTFIWTVAGQQFFKQKGFLPPKFCRECRVKKRIEINEKENGR